ncbi:MAG: hypothetical protein GF392_06240, partial [Candidatus Omnitrophica bacterium]|nr:hypothetical protein [Candidatus Omnitrophota bacterium]
LLDFQVTSGNHIDPVATVKLEDKGKILKAVATGDGPVDACFKTIDKAVGRKGRLVDYKVNAVTSGKDALGEASVRTSFGKTVVSGRGSSTDVIEASVLAYVNAVNHLDLAGAGAGKNIVTKRSRKTKKRTRKAS